MVQPSQLPNLIGLQALKFSVKGLDKRLEPVVWLPIVVYLIL